MTLKITNFCLFHQLKFFNLDISLAETKTFNSSGKIITECDAFCEKVCLCLAPPKLESNVI